MTHPKRSGDIDERKKRLTLSLLPHATASTINFKDGLVRSKGARVLGDDVRVHSVEPETERSLDDSIRTKPGESEAICPTAIAKLDK